MPEQSGAAGVADSTSEPVQAVSGAPAGANEPNSGAAGDEPEKLPDILKALRKENAARRHEEKRLQGELAAKEQELARADAELAVLEARAQSIATGGSGDPLGDAITGLGLAGQQHGHTIRALVELKLSNTDGGAVTAESVAAALAEVRRESSSLFGGGGAFSKDAGAMSRSLPESGNDVMNKYIRRAARGW